MVIHIYIYISVGSYTWTSTTGDTFAARAKWDAGRLAIALGQCQGQECSKPVPAATLPTKGSLPCFEPKGKGWDRLGSFKFEIDPKTKEVRINGWAVDLSAALPGKQNGTAPVIVKLRVNGRFNVLSPQIANISRPDLPKANPNIPDPYHGFATYALPTHLLQGTQKVVLFGQVGEQGTPQPFGGKKGAGEKHCLCGGVSCPCK
jgi:hypothetical protein